MLACFQDGFTKFVDGEQDFGEGLMPLLGAGANGEVGEGGFEGVQDC